MQFTSRLSSRYSRTLGAEVTHLASQVLNCVVSANDNNISNDTRQRLREENLLNARGALSALDVQLSICYDVIMLNPQGAFTSGSGKDVAPSKAMEKLDHMAQSLGEKIDREMSLITAVLKSDKDRARKTKDDAISAAENT